MVPSYPTRSSVLPPLPGHNVSKMLAVGSWIIVIKRRSRQRPIYPNMSTIIVRVCLEIGRQLYKIDTMPPLMRKLSTNWKTDVQILIQEFIEIRPCIFGFKLEIDFLLKKYLKNYANLLTTKRSYNCNCSRGYFEKCFQKFEFYNTSPNISQNTSIWNRTIRHFEFYAT